MVVGPPRAPNTRRPASMSGSSARLMSDSGLGSTKELERAMIMLVKQGLVSTRCLHACTRLMRGHAHSRPGQAAGSPHPSLEFKICGLSAELLDADRASRTQPGCVAALSCGVSAVLGARVSSASRSPTTHPMSCVLRPHGAAIVSLFHHASRWELFQHASR